VMSESYFTAEQQEQIEERRRALGEEGMAAAERGWAELIEAVRSEQARGTDPADPRMLELARRWRSLIAQFTGGDEATRQSPARRRRSAAWRRWSARWRPKPPRSMLRTPQPRWPRS